MPDESITLEFLARLCQQTLHETRALRKDVAEIRSLGLQTIEYARPIERRSSEQAHEEGSSNGSGSGRQPSPAQTRQQRGERCEH